MDGVQFAVYGENLLKFRSNVLVLSIPNRSNPFQTIPMQTYSWPGLGADSIFNLHPLIRIIYIKVTIKTFAGLKILISLFCFGASFYQSFVLFDNFKSKDTLRKNTEVTYPDNYTTPMIIVCSDPGNQKPEEPLIELKKGADLSGLIPPVRVFRTMYKVFFRN